MAKTVKITAGQPFTVFVPLVILNADGTKEAVEANTLTDVSVKAQNGAREYTVPANTYDHYLVLQVSKDLLPVGVYDLIITATLQSGRAFRLAMQEAIGVMSWDWQTNWRDYLVGDHIELCDQPFIAGEFVTDAELEELKRELREAIAEAEQAKEEAIAEKEHYAEAIEQLDDIAKEASVEGIAGKIGTPATGQPSTLFAAIAAGGGGGDAQESTSQAILAAVQSGNVTAIAELLNNAHGLDALRALIAAIPTTAPATPQNITDAQAAIIAAMPSVSGLALDSTVAKEATLGTTADSSVATTIFGWLKAVWDKLVDIVTTYPYAKEATLADATNGLPSIKSLASSAATDAAAAKTAAQGITGYALQGNDSTATNTALATLIGTPASGQQPTLFAAIAAGGGGGGTVYPTVQMTATTAAIDPNKVYIWGEVASLDITLNAGEQGVANVYFLEFYSGGTQTSLTLPAAISDVRGSIKSNSITNVAIFNNIAYIA